MTNIKVEATSLQNAYVLTPQVFGDERGYFHEVFHKEKFAEIGLDAQFVQDNLSYSEKGILRGLHAQWNPHQGKLVRAVKGAIYDVIVDVKRGSPTFGEWFGIELSDKNHKALWLPAGFAHGFVVTSENAIVEYKCTGLYNPSCEISIIYNDPEIGIKWPLSDVQLSAKDKSGITLEEWSKSPEFELYNHTMPMTRPLAIT
ncbi:MAG: dTDP-4-dehydrorhamnose 3,5-epimerase [Candidatus Peregrinibacteria bacterium]|nr:dTDP-4-dehydrorhamnose 3,5-epimerase [Candidatus Peregrinibacteria bacterium]